MQNISNQVVEMAQNGDWFQLISTFEAQNGEGFPDIVSEGTIRDAEKATSKLSVKIYLLSALVYEYKNVADCEYLYQLINSISSKYISEKIYYYHQMCYLLFVFPELNSDGVKKQERILVEEIREIFAQQLYLERIPKERRNANRIVFATKQFLGPLHAPSRSLLERATAMAHVSGMEVYIAPTLEGGTNNGGLPFYGGRQYSFWDDGVKYSQLEYQGVSFNYHQNMSYPDNLEGLYDYIGYLLDINPLMVIYLGGESYVMELVNELFPVVTVSTVFSSLPRGKTQFKIVGRKLTREEKVSEESDVLEIPFTFTMKEKSADCSRKELGIPENSFAVSIIGNRLAEDLTVEFLEWMDKSDVFCVFIGDLEPYQRLCEKHVWMKTRSVSVGRTQNVLGVMECTDLYVNPKRMGGGYSVIEAFHSGIPAVSLRYGDAAIAAGDDFCVDSYQEMFETIQKYKSDEAFYAEMLEKARKREIFITDGEAMFIDAIDKVLSSPNFY